MTDTPNTDALRETVIAAVRDFLAATQTAAVSINVPGASMQVILAGDKRSVAHLLELSWDEGEDPNAARVAHLTHERDTALRAVRLHTARIAELEAENSRLRAGNLAAGLRRAAQYLDDQAAEYLDQYASTEHDTGAVVFHRGEAGREYHATLGELADEIRALSPAAPVSASPQQAAPADDDTQEWARLTGAVALHLIDRHGEDWADIGNKMETWGRARFAASHQAAAGAEGAAPVVHLSDNQIYDFWLFRDCMEAIRNGDMKGQFVAAVRQLLAKPFTVSPWMPIETAPLDGSEVLLMVERRAGIPHRALIGHYMAGGHCIEDHPPIDAGWYFWNGSMFDRASKPTHWMPLPAAPSTSQPAREGE
jgi:hypothetical protein